MPLRQLIQWHIEEGGQHSGKAYSPVLPSDMSRKDNEKSEQRAMEKNILRSYSQKVETVINQGIFLTLRARGPCESVGFQNITAANDCCVFPLFPVQALEYLLQFIAVTHPSSIFIYWIYGEQIIHPSQFISPCSKRSHIRHSRESIMIS